MSQPGAPPSDQPGTEPIIVGTIGKPHGLDGFVVVHPETDNPARFRPGAVLQTDSGRELIVRKARLSEAVVVVSFEGMEDRNGAEGLRGLTLTIPASDRRPLGADEFWPEDFVGLEVRNRAGARIGHVIGIDPEAPQPRLTVDTESGAFVVPLVTALVPEVNVAAGYLVVEPIEGLLGEPEG